MLISSHDAMAHEPPLGTRSDAATAPAVLDATALMRLQELDPSGANKLLERVFKAFESSVQRLAPQLATAREAGDLAGIRHVAHTLKSSSASIGALRLSQLCAEVESASRKANKAKPRPQLQAALAHCRIMGARLIVANVSRLTRDPEFMSKLVDAGDLPQHEGPDRTLDTR